MASEQTPRTVLSTIGGWKLGKTLGRGAYAHVRLATHRNGHKAACKILPALHRPRSTPATWDEVVDAVEAHKELVLLKALAGSGIEGIVGLEGVIVEGGWTYVFLTLYGQSASSVRDPWSWPRLVPFFRRLCHTIHSLHLLGVSHEDLKRSNVLIDDRGRPVVVDFGFSHFNPNGDRMKSAGGTLDYSSPEKVKDWLYDPRANDVWSLAILLIKLLGLPHPFAEARSTNASQKMKERIATCEPNLDWRDAPRPPEHARSLIDLLRRMLQKDPRRRITIPDILAHPYLFSSDIHKMYSPPGYTLPSDVPPLLPVAVLDDVCFLAYLNKEFFLCESPENIKVRILGVEPCWEKRWAGILSRWKQSPEMVRENMPRNLPVVVGEGSVRTPVPLATRALREIHLSPNIQQIAPVVGLEEASKTANIPGASNQPRRASSRRPINGHMKPRAAPAMPTNPHGDNTLSNITVASAMAKPPFRAVPQQQRPRKTPDRVDFRARTNTAPFKAKQSSSTNIPDLTALRKGLEESSQTGVVASGPQAPSPTTNGSKYTSNQSELSLGEGEPPHRQSKSPVKKPSGGKPKTQGGRANAPLRRSMRLQGKENHV